MGLALQSMQRDDAQNPAMLWVQDGQALWNLKTGQKDLSCASCHGTASSMKGVATRYPAFDARLKQAVNLGQRINQCRQKHQNAPPFAFESHDLLSLESHVALQSRGLPISPVSDTRLLPALTLGEQLYRQKIGQLNLSCAQCHDERAGRRLGGSHIPQAHPTAYPIYRLEWQGLGSLQRRLRGCMAGVRAQSFEFDSRELVALELYLANRAAGMPLESPGVRP